MDQKEMLDAISTEMEKPLNELDSAVKAGFRMSISIAQELKNLIAGYTIYCKVRRSKI